LNKRSSRRLPFAAALLCLVLPLATAATAEQSLTPYSAEYKVKISILSGELTANLTKTDGGFDALHVIRPTGLARVIRNGEISEHSRFTASGDGIRTSWYESRDSLSNDAPTAEVSFDWSAHEITGKVNDADVRFDIDGLVLDRVAIQYQLMYDLLNGGPHERYTLYDIDEFKTLVVNVIGEQEVRTPAGKFNAVGIQHRAENSSRVTTLWCVKELGYLPVLIEQHHKGKLRLRASLEKYTPLDG